MTMGMGKNGFELQHILGGVAADTADVPDLQPAAGVVDRCSRGQGNRMSQPEMFSTGADGLDPEVAGPRDGERIRAVLAAAGSVDLLANT